MSDASVNEIIKRANEDAAFRQQLFIDPIATLKAFDLTDEERELLSQLDEDSFEELAGGPMERNTGGTNN